MGAAEARLFVEHGAKVMIADVLDAEAEVLAKELGPAARYIHLDDVTDEDAWAAGLRSSREGRGAWGRPRPACSWSTAPRS
jgi:3alpha(or 20beta)-hydroxysteroid dehydrogenase